MASQGSEPAGGNVATNSHLRAVSFSSDFAAATLLSFFSPQAERETVEVGLGITRQVIRFQRARDILKSIIIMWRRDHVGNQIEGKW